MKQICVFIVVLLCFSCEYFNLKKISPETILNEELETFNLNEVDEYPTFVFCDSLNTSIEKKECFRNNLTQYISGFLKEEIIVVTTDIYDTIVLPFQVSEKGQLTLSNFTIDTLTAQEIPNIKKLIYKSLDSLPKIFPAIKRGQQVKTKFEIPIIIAME